MRRLQCTKTSYSRSYFTGLPLAGALCFFHGFLIMADLLLFMALTSYVTLFMGVRKGIFVLKILAIMALVIGLITVVISGDV